MKCISSLTTVILYSMLLGGWSLGVAARHSGRVRRQIYPGTKWCGAGNIATSYEDLGTDEDVDRCCREHDHCDHWILSGETKYGLVNDGLMTVSECKCDIKFGECLQKIGDATSNGLDYMFHNTLGAPCFYFDRNGKAVLNGTEGYSLYAAERRGRKFWNYDWSSSVRATLSSAWGRARARFGF